MLERTATKEIPVFDELTTDLLDLTAQPRGLRGASFALNIDCCSCSCCWS
jgi:hypothetical protein